MTEILDIHHHIGPRERLTGEHVEYDFKAALEKHVRTMDEFGVAHACLIASHNARITSVQDVRWLNTQVAEARNSQPDRFVAAAGTVDPALGDAGIEEIDYCIGELQLNALAWHTWFSGVFVDSPSIRRYVKHVASLGKPVFLHMIAEHQSEAPWRVAHLAEQIPEVQIIALDAFTSVDQSQWIVEMGGRIPNVTFDLSLARGGSSGVIEQFVQRYGAERLVFGSDYYDDTRTRFPGGLFEARTADISDADREMILSTNARRLLGIEAAS